MTDQMSPMVGLIGSMGSSAAAIFVVWFLVSQFTQQSQQAITKFLERIQSQHDELMAVTKDKGQVIREVSVVGQRVVDTIDQMSERIARIESKMYIDRDVTSKSA